MLALYRSGRQSEALAAYRDARTALVEAIGVEPGPELRHLHEAILRQDPRLEPTGAVDASGLPPELDAATPLVGREADLEWLRGHWRRALAGAGRLVLVAGERGIGKTRLVAELAVRGAAGTRSRAVRLSARVARGAGRRTLGRRTDPADPRRRHRRGGELDPARSVSGLEGRAVLVVATAEHVASAASLRPAGTLILKPLSADGVRALAHLYAGATEDVDVPVERLLAASGGLPRLLHGAASEWARMLELRRLADSVGRITADRSGLRAAEDDLVGSIVKLQAAGERTESHAVEGTRRLPVQGAGLLRGRRRGILLRARAVGGRAGRAGDGHPVPGDRRAVWQRQVLGTARRPARRARRGRASRQRALGARRVASRRASAARARAGARRGARPRPAGRGGRPVRGGVHDLPRRVGARGVRRRARGLRARCAPAHAGGRRRARRLLRSLRRLHGAVAAPGRQAPCSSARCSAEELRRAIELPARRAGLLVERELVDALVADVEGQPGALPLVSSALLELWQRRDGRTLRRSDYEQAGGVRGAVARQAEQAYEQLDPAGRRLARRVLLRLAGEGEGDAVVRRRARLSEFEGDAGRARSRRPRRGAADHDQRGRGGGRARGPAARVAATADVARGRRRRTPAAPAPDACGPRLGFGRPRSGGALPGRPAGFRARLDRPARARAGRARARVRRREPRRGGARGRAPAAGESSPAAPAGRTRSLAGARGGRRVSSPFHSAARRAKPP